MTNKLLALLILAPTLALAQIGPDVDSTAANRITTTTSSQSSWLKRNFSVVLKSELYGPSLTDFSGSYRPNYGYNPDLAYNPKDARTNPYNSKDPVHNELKAQIGYKIGETSLTGVGIEGDLVSEKGGMMKDPYVYVRDTKFIDVGDFTMDAQARVYGGLSASSRASNMEMAFRFVQDSYYRLWGTGFQLELHSYHTAYDRSISLREKHWIAPVVSYTFNKALSVNVAAKVMAYRFAGDGPFHWNADAWTVGPGVFWKPIAGLTVNPFIDFSPSNAFSPRTTTVGLFLGYNII